MRLKSNGMILVIVLLCVGYFLHLISDILMPFIAALFFAYFLDPLVDRLQKLGFSRFIATMLVTVLFFTVLGVVITLIFPPFYRQALSLVEKIQQYKMQSSSALLELLIVKLEQVHPEARSIIQESLADFSSYFFTFAGNIFSKIFKSSLVAFNILSLLFITPIVTYYILRDWQSMIEQGSTIIPLKYNKDAAKIFGEINVTLSGYLRSQTYVCLLLGAFYAVGLKFIGLESGLILGMMTGIFTFIPYIGAIFGAILCTLIAAIQFGSWHYVLMVLGLFLVGQFIEGNFVAPKIIGQSVGLHPVWLMFGLLAGGSLLGFFGILLAVPLTAIIGVVIRFVLVKYKNSNLYTK